MAEHQVRKVRYGENEFLIPSNSIIREHARPDEYQQLVRQTFEQMRDIQYQKFHHEFFESAKAVEKYPDPAAREEKMREYWIVKYEDKWPGYLLAHPLNMQELQRQTALSEIA